MYLAKLGIRKQRYLLDGALCCVERDRVTGRQEEIMGLLWQLVIVGFSQV